MGPLLAAAALLPACTSRAALENDRLRTENQSLKSQIDLLTATNAELSAKLLEASAARGTPVDADVLSALPRVASLELGGLTGFSPGDRSKLATSINVYLRPLDGRRRFTQAVGTLNVEARVLPPSLGEVADTTPRPEFTLRRQFSPAQLRDVYRSGLSGTHYEIELPLEASLTDRSASIVIRVEFVDAVTGQTHKAEKIIPVQIAAPRRP